MVASRKRRLSVAGEVCDKVTCAPIKKDHSTSLVKFNKNWQSSIDRKLNFFELLSADSAIPKFGHFVIVCDRIVVQTVGAATQIFRIENGNI